MKSIDPSLEFLNVNMIEYSTEDKVRILWMLQRLWNRRPLKDDMNLTVHQAINLCNSILNTARPNSSLEKFTAEYLDDLINHGCKTHKERALKKKAK